MAREFYTKAVEYLTLHPDHYFELRRDSPSYARWWQYFDGMDWAPLAFCALAKGDAISATVPCEWPEWMVTEFAAVPERKPSPPRVRGKSPSYYGPQWVPTEQDMKFIRATRRRLAMPPGPYER
jgi:hypothetical protein